MYTFIQFHGVCVDSDLKAATKRIGMTIKESCVDNNVETYLEVVKNLVYGWIKERKLPSHWVERFIPFRLSEIDDWVRQDNRQDKSSSSIQDKSLSKSHTKKSTAKKAS